MNDKIARQSPLNSPEFSRLIGVVWAAVMLIATFTVDKPSNTVPFWLLLIAYYIVRWQRQQR